MNYRLPNPLGQKYRDNFDKTFRNKDVFHYEYKFMDKEEKGPLCGVSGLTILTENEEEVTCINCRKKLKYVRP
jgi:hypothetical protein